MKTRLSSTIWLLVIWTSVALFAVLGLAYDAGSHSGGVSIFQGGATGAGPELLLASVVAAFTALGLLLTLPRRVLRPIGVKDAEWTIGYGKPTRVRELNLFANWGGATFTPRATARGNTPSIFTNAHATAY